MSFLFPSPSGLSFPLACPSLWPVLPSGLSFPLACPCLWPVLASGLSFPLACPSLMAAAQTQSPMSLSCCCVDPNKSPKVVKTEIGEAVEGLEQIPEEAGEDTHQANVNSDEDIEGEKPLEESRSKKLQRSTKQQVENIKGQLEKTKLKTKENLEKTRQKTRDNFEKTKHTLEKKITKIGTRMTPNMERRAKMKSSKDKLKKSLTPDHPIKARSRNTVYRVPPFTFHVKKIRDGQTEEEAEVGENQTEMVEVPITDENGFRPEEEEEEEELVHLDTPDMVEALLEVTEVVTVEPGHHKK
uniref:Caveolae associated protein 1a n=1 Tax=Knipowitschia caucasica TaxID=637954 RepID=A0AAV2KGV0_KNICA